MAFEKRCPLVLAPCLQHGCEFYRSVPAKPDDFRCVYHLTFDALQDIGNLLSLSHESHERQRDFHVQMARSAATGGPTPELLRHIGVEKEDLPRLITR